MKKGLFLFICLIINAVALTQVMPEAFLPLVPEISSAGTVCTMKASARNEFLIRLDSISEKIDRVSLRRRNDEKANADIYKKQALNNVSKQYNLSEAEMQKLQSGKKMTKEEQKALADKMLQNSSNISMDEINNLKKMDKDAKKAWAEAYSTEVMADQAADPKKYQDKQLHDKKLLEISTAQKNLTDSLMATETKFVRQMAELDNDSVGVTMRRNISKWEKERDSLIGNDANNRIEAISQRIKAEKENYCTRFTPKFVTILKSYREYTKASLPASYRLEKLMEQSTYLQTGVELKQEPGYIGIGKVRDFIHTYRNIFKYNLLGAMEELGIE